MRLILLAMFAPARIWGSTLHLTGQPSSIQFGDGAVLSASCRATGLGPTVVQMNMTRQHLVQNNDTAPVIRAFFVGMPITCSYATPDQPCASVESRQPPLFYCAWHGSGGSAIHLGPFRASVYTEVLGTEATFYQAFLDCPQPSLDQIRQLANGSPQSLISIDVEISLSVIHFAPLTADASIETHGLIIPYSGLYGENRTAYMVHAPPAAPPPLPPSASCEELKAGGSPSGVYSLLYQADAEPFLGYCDMDTDGGGWLKLATSMGEKNYMAYGYSADNSNDKCGYDGLSTQKDGKYNHEIKPWAGDDYGKGGKCEHQKVVTYADPDGNTYSSSIMAEIRAWMSTLSTSTRLFAASCDDDNLGVCSSPLHHVSVDPLRSPLASHMPFPSHPCRVAHSAHRRASVCHVYHASRSRRTHP